MKITIYNGETLENALSYLREYLGQYTESYPILKNNLTLYVTLKDEKRKICPDNDAELVLSDNCVVDVEETRRLAAQEETLRAWQYFIQRKLESVEIANGAVETDLRYLRTAVEKGRKPENIERRKLALERHRKEVAEAERQTEYFKKLAQQVENNDFSWFFLKQIIRNSSYNYDIDAFMVFRDSTGKECYFTKPRGLCATQGILRQGVPKGWIRASKHSQTATKRV